MKISHKIEFDLDSLVNTIVDEHSLLPLLNSLVVYSAKWAKAYKSPASPWWDYGLEWTEINAELVKLKEKIDKMGCSKCKTPKSILPT